MVQRPRSGACLPDTLVWRAWPAPRLRIILKAGVTVIPAKTFNNPKAITMWGFAKCDAAFANCSSVQVPGPTLTATAGQALSITVMNNLNGLPSRAGLDRSSGTDKNHDAGLDGPCRQAVQPVGSVGGNRQQANSGKPGRSERSGIQVQGTVF